MIGTLRAMFFSVLIALVGVGFLGWQYRRIEQKQLPAIEEKIEEAAAQRVLDKFMIARIAKNEAQAMLYLTEGAAQQKNQREFTLINNFESYNIFQTAKAGENVFRFAATIYEEGGLINFVEIITLIKISDNYYVDSIIIAG